MEINGKYLGWSIIHLILFTYMVLKDFEIEEAYFGFVLLFLMIFFTFRFVENMKKTFEKTTIRRTRKR